MGRLTTASPRGPGRPRAPAYGEMVPSPQELRMTSRPHRPRRPNLKAIFGLPLAAVLAVFGLGAVPAASAAGRGPGHVVSRDWLGEVNYYRVAAGLAPVREEKAWDRGIRDHLVYLAKTPARDLTGTYASLHSENPDSPYFTAAGATGGGFQQPFLRRARLYAQRLHRRLVERPLPCRGHSPAAAKISGFCL